MVEPGACGFVCCLLVTLILSRPQLFPQFVVSFVRVVTVLESAATDVVWEEDGSLYLACANGTMVTVPNVEPPSTHHLDNKTAATTDATTLEVDDADTAPAADAARKDVPTAQELVVDDDDASDDGLFASGGVDSSTAAPKFVDDEAQDDDGSDLDDVPTTHLGESVLHNGDDLNEEANNVDLNEVNDGDSMEDEFDYTAATDRPPKPLPDRQDAFAPSATPLDMDRRFLCWNHLGSIVRRQDALAPIDIQFTDSMRRPITMTDTAGFILGSLGEDGAMFCTDVAATNHNNDLEGLSASVQRAVQRSGKAQGAGSTLFFHRHNTFSSKQDKDWNITLSSGELALGCATGDGWAAVMTRCVYFIYYGMQVLSHDLLSITAVALFVCLPPVATRETFIGWMESLLPWQVEGVLLLACTMRASHCGMAVSNWVVW